MTAPASEVLAAHAGISVLSLDFFDTLVTRSVAQPTHVFAVMEEELVARMGRRWDGFALRRVLAERAARASRDEDDVHVDVTLEEIHVALASSMDLDPAEREMLAALERRTECALAVPVAHGAELLDAGRAAGLRVVVVSDNYMPASHLVEMASAAGITLPVEDVFVSCERAGMKHDGSIWPGVLRDIGVEGREVLHVGDLDDADGVIPARFGIRTHVVDVMRRVHREPLNTCPEVLPLSRIEAASRDHAAPFAWDATVNLAQGALAIIVAGQVLDITRRCSGREVAGVHFTSRDGFLASEAYSVLWESGAGVPPFSYVEISRSITWRASVTEVNSETLRRFVGDDESMTIGRLEDRFGCRLESGHGPDDLLDAAACRGLLLENADAVLVACRALRARLMEHLDARGVTRPGHHIIMDLGWTGSVVSDLARIIREERGEGVTFEGCLTGLYWDATPNRTELALHGLAFDEFAPVDDNVRLLGMLRYFEALVTEEGGAVVDYERGHAVRGAGKGGPDIHPDHGHWRKMALNVRTTASSIVRGLHPLVSPAQVTPAVVRAAMLQVGHTPTAAEVQALSTVRHETAVDHAGEGDPLVKPLPGAVLGATPDELAHEYDSLVRHHWLQGSLVQWESAPGTRWVADEIRRLWPMFSRQWVRP